jgi:hypothetical protein
MTNRNDPVPLRTGDELTPDEIKRWDDAFKDLCDHHCIAAAYMIPIVATDEQGRSYAARAKCGGEARAVLIMDAVLERSASAG